MAQAAVAQLSMPLPGSPDTRIYMRLSTQAKAIVLALTTAAEDELAAPKAMGSFVYALPDRGSAQQPPLATTLFAHEPTLDLTTRLAKLLARRAQRPAYVANSMSFARAAMGGTVEEEMESLRAIVHVALERLPGPATGSAATASEAAS